MSRIPKITLNPKWLQSVVASLFLMIIIYGMTRTIFTYYADYDALERTLAICFLASEAFIMFHAFGYFMNIYRLCSPNRSGEPAVVPIPDPAPSVAILVPARHEPKEVLAATFRAVQSMVYSNKEVYFLDDSSDEKYLREAEELAVALNLKLFRRKIRRGAKAGVINDCVKSLDHKYIVIFDADQCPMSGFLSATIPFMEADPKLAFVQTPQFYSNLGFSRVSLANNIQQAVFYEYICEGKSATEAMICCGTNVVLRREALTGAGGLDESTVTEDFATSVKLHAQGWKTLYYNHVLCFGMGPEDLGSYFQQQNRWAIGNVGVLRKILKRLFCAPKSLRFGQWLEYFITGSYYLVSWAYLFLILCPIAYIFFNVPSFFMSGYFYGFTFFPYFILSLSIFFSCMMSRHYTWRQLFLAQLLSFITLPVYMRASFNGIIGRRGSFNITSKDHSSRIPYRYLWPQILLWSLNLAAATWAAHRLYHEHTAAIALNLCWVVWHFLMFSSIFYFNEENTLERVGYPRLTAAVLEHRQLDGADEAVEENELSKKNCILLSMSSAPKKGARFIYKIRDKLDRTVLFHAKVLWVNPSRRRSGYDTIIAIQSISKSDKILLDQMVKK